jgi:hypothetical protein
VLQTALFPVASSYLQSILAAREMRIGKHVKS